MPVLTLDWAHITRAAAIAAYAALTLGMCLGLIQRVPRRNTPLAASLLADAHEFAILLAALLMAVHLAALWLSPLLTFPAATLLLPWGDPRRPVAHALGAVGLYAMALVLFTSWLRRRLPPRFWRRLHSVSFAAFILSSAHGLLAGSDSHSSLMHIVYAVSVASVVVTALAHLVLRVSRRAPHLRDTPASAPLPMRLRS